jgi:hypothetical protein
VAQHHHQTSWIVLATVIACLGGAQLRAADDPAEQILKKHGLRLVGLMAVAETEAPFKSKLTEARRIAQQIRLLRMQDSSTMSNEERQQAIYSLNQSIGQLRNELNAVTRQLNQVPMMRGRMLNNYAYGAVDELQAYQASIQVELSEESAMLNQLKGPAADPKAKEKIEAGIKEKTATYNQALVDLRKLADETTKKYSDLGENEEVKKVLATLSKGRKDKIKLGPSRDFSANVKVLDRLEKAAAQGETEDAPAKSTRRSRKTAKAKRTVGSDE